MPISSAAAGLQLDSYRERISVRRVLAYAAGIGATAPLSFDDDRAVALAAGLPDIILHGTATWALAAREILRLYADNDPRRLRRLHGRFRAMVLPGTAIRVEHARGSGGAVRFAVRNHAGEAAIEHGLAVLE